MGVSAKWHWSQSPGPPAKSSKNLRRKSNSNVSGLWAEVSWRNKSFSQQSQREITGHSIGMHSGHFYVPKGKFPNFLDKAGQQILWKSLSDIEDTRRERRVV